MTKTFFTGDTHFGHANIIKYCHRPFATVTEMDEALIANWNHVVTPDDLVYHLGDFCFGNTPAEFHRYFDRLNGAIVLIKGNHDKLAWRHRHLFRAFFDSYLEIKLDMQLVTLCHYAMRVFRNSHYGAWHLYGHSHGTLPDDPHTLSFDAGVDCHHFTPLSLEQVTAIMAKKTFKPVDHHHETEPTRS